MNWDKCKAIEDPSYVNLRNGLIAKAEENADKLARFEPLPSSALLRPLSGQNREDVRWNRYFLAEMDRLARLYGLLS